MKQILDEYISQMSENPSQEEQIQILAKTAKKMFSHIPTEELESLARLTVENENSSEGWDGVTF